MSRAISLTGPLVVPPENQVPEMDTPKARRASTAAAQVASGGMHVIPDNGWFGADSAGGGPIAWSAPIAWDPATTSPGKYLPKVVTFAPDAQPRLWTFMQFMSDSLCACGCEKDRHDWMQWNAPCKSGCGCAEFQPHPDTPCACGFSLKSHEAGLVDGKLMSRTDGSTWHRFEPQDAPPPKNKQGKKSKGQLDIQPLTVDLKMDVSGLEAEMVNLREKIKQAGAAMAKSLSGSFLPARMVAYAQAGEVLRAAATRNQANLENGAKIVELAQKISQESAMSFEQALAAIKQAVE